MEIINIAAYKFVEVPNPLEFRAILKERCAELALMGSILIATEGINLFIAGERGPIDAFLHFLRTDPRFAQRFADIAVKESITDHQPFRRIVVRVKDEIVRMRHPTICPDKTKRAPAVDPLTLKRWLDQGCDDTGKEVVLLDTRNGYEVGIGTFKHSVDFGIDCFSDFPDAVNGTTDDTTAKFAGKTIVSFCTGGIRCEKAALFLREANFENVFQLDGGILRYFEEVGGEHWQGECFVFDRRVALDPQLQPTKNQYDVTAPPERNEKFLKWQAAQKEKTTDDGPKVES